MRLYDTVFMFVLMLYLIHSRHRVDGRSIRYEHTWDSVESDIV